MATEKTTLEKFKEVIGDKLKEVKQLFEVPVVAEPVTVAAFTDVKTTDGVVLRVTEMKVGGSVTVIDASGETPAQDGVYALENGAAITVAAGAITVVEDAKTENAEGDPAMMNELAEVKESVKSITYKYAEIEKQIVDLALENKTAFELITKENEKLSAQNKAMFSIIEQIAGLPTEEPAQKPKEQAKTGRLAEFRAEVKAIKAARKETRD